MIAGGNARGKSELHRAGCSVTQSRGDVKESATERKPPLREGDLAHEARVKGCGKSAPVLQATGEAWQTPPGARPNRRAFEGGPSKALGLVAGDVEQSTSLDE